MQDALRRISRSRTDRVVAGVAAGLGDYIGVDPTIVRLAFVLLTFAGGIGIAVYAAAWMLFPEAPLGGGTDAHAPTARRFELVELVAAGLLVVGLVFAFRAVRVWPGDALVWPAILAGAGLVLLWRRSPPERRESVADSLRRLRERDSLARIAVGVALLVAGVATFVALSDAAEAVGKGLVAALIVVAGLALIFLPWVRRLVGELAEERRERIRSQERAELAAHLHDSVLQTLALIQRRSESPETVVRLARRQERELRAWLSGPPPSAADRTLVAAVRQAAEEVEDLHGVPIEVVVVGDCPLDERLDALVAAAREAMTNAARLSGADEVAVYLEVEDDRATLYVRDRGIGFDLDAVPSDRKGVSESIVGRMQRHGGLATIHTAPGSGTEVELELPRQNAGAGTAASELSRT
jgi:signal transduction histidine kinase/phage shock protein PspC (stress-responsive transcriptional regulator)